jgi:putative two-component system response regulator
MEVQLMIVLTVDDSDLNLAVYRAVLSKLEDAKIVGYSSALAALEYAKAQVPDVVVVDYQMPELDGLQFIERFRRLPGCAESLIVMVTASDERALRHDALELGVNDFLTKPVDGIEFAARMRNLLALARSRKALSDRAAWLREEVARATAALLDREIETIVRLTRAAEFRDEATGMHVIRVGHTCAALARKIGFPEDECRKLLLAAPMHDIGKVATPDKILLKPGPLTPEEFEIMKQHTVAGYEILKDSTSAMLACAAEIALTHHERYDGSGYPRGLRGNAIPVSGRLCGLADVFDALTSVRPYKPAWPVEAACAEIDASRGKAFDPELITVFHNTLPEIVAIKERFSDRGAGATSLVSAFT